MWSHKVGQKTELKYQRDIAGDLSAKSNTLKSRENNQNVRMEIYL